MKHFQHSYSVSAWCLCQQQAGFVSSFIISALLSAESVAQGRFQPWQMLFFLVLCGSCCRRWVSANAAWFLRLCLILHPDPTPRWELGACHSHTPHCCPPPWWEIWVAGVKGAALFLDWVWRTTDQQPKVPKESQMNFRCSPCEKTGLRSLNLRCRFLKVPLEVKDPRNHILQYTMCCSSLICIVTWMTLGVQRVPGSMTQLWGSFWWSSRVAQPVPLHQPPHPCLDLEARWVLRESWAWDVSSSAHESREGLP